VVFPLRDDNPTLDSATITLGLIATNFAAWALLQGLGSEPLLSRSVCELGAIPGELLGRVPPGTAVALGPGAQCVIEDHANWASALTAMFMHGSWLHLIANMWFLWVFGDNVEDAMSRARFLAFYLLCGLAAFAAQVVSNPSSPVPMVGASGAIGGIMGGYWRLYPRAPVHLLVFFFRMVVPASVVLGYWFLLQILSGLPGLASGARGGVAFWAHAGGFLAGVLLIGRFVDPERIAAHGRMKAQRALLRRGF
jgi:membrane associated rhomboid family serine protease